MEGSSLPPLTHDGVPGLFRQRSTHAGASDPILQVIEVGQFQKSGNQVPLYVLSDGTQHVAAKLSAPMQGQFPAGTLPQLSVVRIQAWQTFQLQQQHVLVIQALQLLGVAPARVGESQLFCGAPVASTRPLPSQVQQPQLQLGSNHLPPTQQPPPPRVKEELPDQFCGDLARARVRHGSGVVGQSAAPASSAPQQQPPAGNLTAFAPQSAQPRRQGSASVADVATPIRELNSYNPRWRIEARVVKKNTPRVFKYKVREGEGKLFSVELIDKSGGETRATFFSEAVDKYYDRLVEGHMYSFAKGRLKVANRQFYSRGEHEITFDDDAIIEEVTEDGNCPQNVFNFLPGGIAGVKDSGLGSIIDLPAILAVCDGALDCPLRAGGTKPKHDVTLIDDSGASIRFTLWGDQATDPRLVEGAPAIIKGVKISDFGGCSLSSNFGTQMYLGAEAVAVHPRAAELQRWYAAQGSEALRTCQSLSNIIGGGSTPQRLAELQGDALDLELQSLEKAQQQKFHTVSPATITSFYMDRCPYYRACPEQVADERNPGKPRSCNKKMEQLGAGQKWQCAHGHECDQPATRWMTTFFIADESGIQSVSGFDESLEKIFGISAGEFAELWDKREVDAVAAARVEEVYKARTYTQWRMRLKSKKETWNDEERLRVTIVEASPLDLLQAARLRLQEVQGTLASIAGA